MVKRTVGRPSIFIEHDALNIAQNLFWTKGYEETSLNDLTARMGINRSSFYRAFESKESLFKACVKDYIDTHLSFIPVAIEAADIRAFIALFLKGAVNLMTQHEVPRGCLLVQAILNCGDENKGVAEHLAQARMQIENALRKRIQQAQVKQQIKEGQSAVEITKMLMTVYCGLSIQASSGTSRNELYKLTELTMKAIDIERP